MTYLFSECHFEKNSTLPSAPSLELQFAGWERPLFRYVSERFASAFVDRGSIRLNSFEALRNIEDVGAARVDGQEGIASRRITGLIPPHLSADVLGITTKAPEGVLSVGSTFVSRAEPGYVFCLSQRPSTNLARKWGEHGCDAACFEILDPVALSKKITEAIRMTHPDAQDPWCMQCLYITPNAIDKPEHLRHPSAFRKPLRFIAEAEYRLYWKIHRGEYPPCLDLKIGAIQHLVRRIPVKELVKRQSLPRFAIPAVDSYGRLCRYWIDPRKDCWGECVHDAKHDSNWFNEVAHPPKHVMRRLHKARRSGTA